MNVLMPQLGETVAEGTVAAWHKAVGDEVRKDEVLLDVETDKAATEVPAPIAGVITEIRVPEGQTVDVGSVLAVIRGADEAAVDPAAAVSSAPVTESRPVAEASDPVGTVAQGTPSEAVAPRSDRLRLSPVVRRLLSEHDLDPTSIQGTGRDGRITRADVRAAADGRESAPTPAEPKTAVEPTTAAALKTAAAPPAAFEPTFRGRTDAADSNRIPFDRIRRLTAEHMVRSKATSPHVLQAIEVDFGAVDVARLAARDRFKRERGYSLTYLPFIARAVCLALKEFPRVNASVDGDGLVVHPQVHLSIAVALELEGVIAPVIRDAGELTVTGLAQRIVDLSRRAREGGLGADDLVGGTYTLTNNGSFGTLMTAPIINQPQVGILSIDGIAKRPVVIEAPSGDSIGIRPIGILAHSFDHRAVDGAYSGAFLARVRSLLESKDWSQEL
jgi:2-oxoglutarate dehydrogenase E2 component (dihydrolipoamide succinyltransferase)